MIASSLAVVMTLFMQVIWRNMGSYEWSYGHTIVFSYYIVTLIFSVLTIGYYFKSSGILMIFLSYIAVFMMVGSVIYFLALNGFIGNVRYLVQVGIFSAELPASVMLLSLLLIVNRFVVKPTVAT